MQLHLISCRHCSRGEEKSNIEPLYLFRSCLRSRFLLQKFYRIILWLLSNSRQIGNSEYRYTFVGLKLVICLCLKAYFDHECDLRNKISKKENILFLFFHSHEPVSEELPPSPTKQKTSSFVISIYSQCSTRTSLYTKICITMRLQWAGL